MIGASKVFNQNFCFPFLSWLKRVKAAVDEQKFFVKSKINRSISVCTNKASVKNRWRSRSLNDPVFRSFFNAVFAHQHFFSPLHRLAYLRNVANSLANWHWRGEIYKKGIVEVQNLAHARHVAHVSRFYLFFISKDPGYVNCCRGYYCKPGTNRQTMQSAHFRNVYDPVRIAVDMITSEFRRRFCVESHVHLKK